MEGEMKTVKAVTIFSHHIKLVIYLPTVEDSSGSILLGDAVKGSFAKTN